MRFLLLAAILLLPPSWAGATMHPSDFAYGMPLNLKGEGALYRLPVPREIYETVTRDDLTDLRIFNGKKAVVPHLLRRPKRKNEIPEKKKSLPFFPLYRKEKSVGPEGVSVRIEKDADGTIIHVESAAVEDGEKRWVSAYIIDAGKEEDRIHALDITWLPESESFVTNVVVKYSHDLTRWTPMVSRAKLARMQFGGHEIYRNRILLPAKRGRYLRLSWPDGRDGIGVKDVVAVQRTGKRVRENRWTGFEGVPGPDDGEKNKTAYEYDSGARLPIDRIRLHFTEKNTLLRAALFSRPSLESKWRHRQNGIFYHLRFEETVLIQDTVSIGRTSDRYWRIEIEKGAFGDPGNIPGIELGWLPHELLFVAQGEGPFMLAYGSARLGEEAANSSAPELLAQVVGKGREKLLKEAMPLPKTILGGPEQLTPEPPPFPWKKWLLWGILVAGVAMIAKMALSLGKGMNKP